MDCIGFVSPRSSSIFSDSLLAIQGSKQFVLIFNAHIIRINDQDFQKKSVELGSFDKDIAGLAPEEYRSDEKHPIWLSQPFTKYIFCHHVSNRAPCQPQKDSSTNSMHQVSLLFGTGRNGETIYLDQSNDPLVPSKEIGIELWKQLSHLLFSLQSLQEQIFEKIWKMASDKPTKEFWIEFALLWIADFAIG